MEPYKTFFLPFDYTKLNLFIRNNPFKKRGKTIASDDEEAPNNSES